MKERCALLCAVLMLPAALYAEGPPSGAGPSATPSSPPAKLSGRTMQAIKRDFDNSVRHGHPGRTERYARELSGHPRGFHHVNKAYGFNGRGGIHHGRMGREPFGGRSWSNSQRVMAAGALSRAFPNNAGLRAAYAQGLINIGDYKGGLREAKIATMLDPSDPIIRSTLAQAQFHTNDYKGARENAQRSVDGDPKNPEANAILRLAQGRDAPAED